jgi:hypothetical protein
VLSPGKTLAWRDRPWSNENADIQLDDPQPDLCESVGYPREGNGAHDSWGFRRLPVVERDKGLVGMISERDVGRIWAISLKPGQRRVGIQPDFDT